ncbi:hypothetical protein [Xanthobacter sp. 126]|uniref:hypothetical protein n=1 Tax=Xanthobacter sp. 126 TaxID=1131814 RepID=UPI00045EAB26|nr:hypothetical protein [Xanthobacter sp. 126]
MATNTPASDDPKAENFSSRPPRTPPTLDLKAQEIARAPVTSEPAASGTPAEEPVAAPALADASVGTEAPEKSAEQVAETEVRQDGDTPADPSPPPHPAPEAPRKGGGGTVFAALIAGLIGGGAAAGGLWYALPILYPPAPVAAPKVDLSPLQSRIAALEARPAVDPRAIAALSERLDRDEATLKAVQEALAGLKAAPAAAPSAAPAAPAIPPALVKSVDDLKTAAEQGREALAALRRDVDALKGSDSALRTAVAAATTGTREAGAKVEALAPQVQALIGATQSLAPQVQALATQTQALGPQVQGLEKQAEAIGPRFDALKKQIEEASAAATQFNRTASSLVVVAAFRDAVVSGRPFAAELAAARATLGANAGQLDAFAAAAEKGFAPSAALAARLAQEGAAALGAAAPAPANTSASLMDRLMSSAENLVKVRPATGPGSVDSEGLLGTAVTQVRAGQLDEALKTLKQLPDSVQQRLAVIRDIEARAAAVKAAGSLFQQQLAAISGKVP